jgi:hypothetical protein
MTAEAEAGRMEGIGPKPAYGGMAELRWNEPWTGGS